MKKYIYLFAFLVSLPFLSGCNEKDDLTGIFTGKSWVLIDILKNGTGYFVWADLTEEERDNSKRLLNTKGNFTITFTGLYADGTLSGTYSGRAVNTNFSNAKWSVNEKREFYSERFSTSSEPIELANLFLDGLRNADSYEGDYTTLTLYYKQGNQYYSLLFHRLN